MKEENRSLVIVTDDDCEVVGRIMLNDDQVRLLEWLIDHQWLNEDYKNFQIMDKEDTPIII